MHPLYRNVLRFEIVEQAPPGDNCDWRYIQTGSD